MISDSSRCVSSMARIFHMSFTQREFPMQKPPGRFWNHLAQYTVAATLIASVSGCHTPSAGIKTSETADGLPAVTAPPESFYQTYRDADREIARKFYKKYMNLRG